MNIFYTEKGDTQMNVRAASVGEAAQLLGVPESEVKDAGEVPMIPVGFDDIDIDTTAYDEWEKSLASALSTIKPEGVCEISKYFPGVVCNDSAKHLWGHGSIIQVCETHGKWNPLMSEDDATGTNLALTQ